MKRDVDFNREVHLVSDRAASLGVSRDLVFALWQEGAAEFGKIPANVPIDGGSADDSPPTVTGPVRPLGCWESPPADSRFYLAYRIVDDWRNLIPMLLPMAFEDFKVSSRAEAFPPGMIADSPDVAYKWYIDDISSRLSIEKLNLHQPGSVCNPYSGGLDPTLSISEIDARGGGDEVSRLLLWAKRRARWGEQAEALSLAFAAGKEVGYREASRKMRIQGSYSPLRKEEADICFYAMQRHGIIPAGELALAMGAKQFGKDWVFSSGERISVVEFRSAVIAAKDRFKHLENHNAA